MKFAALALAIVLMSVAHFLRTIRWELFIKVYEKPDRKRLLSALSLGYLANYIVPYKLGDLLRGYYSGRKMKNGKALGLSTVIVDRYLDILAVGLIFCVLSLVQRGDATFASASRFYIILFVSLIAVTVLVFLFKNVLKKIVRFFAGIFNQRIEGIILRFTWALIWNFKDIVLKLNKIKLIVVTVGMWFVYILSYGSFAWFYTSLGTDTGWRDIFLMLFGESGVKASTVMISLFNGEVAEKQLYFVVYMLLPLLILFLVSLIVKRFSGDKEDESEYLNLLPQINAEERLVFLDKYFSGENREYINNYLKINQGVSIIRDYSAGSNATTMLCVDNRGTFFRKYAFGKDGEKLSEQVKWIEAYRNILPLPEILKNDSNEFYCYYDMPYDSATVGMFEYAHSMPTDKSMTILRNVFDKLENTLYKASVCEASVEDIDSYISEKVVKNLDRIYSARKLRPLCDYDTVVINGKEYRNLKFYEKMLSRDNLMKVFSKDGISAIHGDLTVENIVCVRKNGEEDDFYLIDPNTGNILDSPNLDYGKMLQSLHGGYEFLMSVRSVKVTDNRIDFLFAKSAVYESLYEETDRYLREHFSEERVKSIYYHEIVHWLRLMPYKIDKDYYTAPAFYAGLLMVLDDVYKRFSES
ncbi:MAG: flippase-like domain-containing protein [Lachnospiraceae bacterium]|nr:flippase-like domain-containing protein [Lachnospiraceae bacterium]